jgi:hypothetical protein
LHKDEALAFLLLNFFSLNICNPLKVFEIFNLSNQVLIAFLISTLTLCEPIRFFNDHCPIDFSYFGPESLCYNNDLFELHSSSRIIIDTFCKSKELYPTFIESWLSSLENMFNNWTSNCVMPGHSTALILSRDKLTFNKPDCIGWLVFSIYSGEFSVTQQKCNIGYYFISGKEIKVDIQSDSTQIAAIPIYRDNHSLCGTFL